MNKKNKKLLRVISALVAVVMLSGTAVFAADEPLTWDQKLVNDAAELPYDDLSMPFTPADKYVSVQNPPDFKWKQFPDATSYDLIVATDPELKNIKYSKYGIPNSFYNFDHTFETGIQYWWAVRYVKGTRASGWSQPRRFRIDPDAYEFVLPDLSGMLELLPDTHPRIFATQETLEDYRGYKDKYESAKKVYDDIIQRADEAVASDDPGSEPDMDYETWAQPDRSNNQGIANREGGIVAEKALYCGLAYLMSGEEKYADFAIRVLLELSTWNIYGSTSYSFQDQVHRAISLYSAMAFDWVYDRMTEEQRAPVVAMVRERTMQMAYLIDSLEVSPYDSHGWTACGYIGLIAIAMQGEIPEADEWLERVVPLYAAVLPPWSTQDGGWSQGTDYWQYSTNSNKEFMDVLYISGIIDLYQKAWQHNEVNWVLYAYPHGSYGSFGDQAGRSKPRAVYHSKSMSRLAYYGNNPLAKWLSDQVGEREPDYYTYPISPVDEMKTEPPLDYQLAHEFNDIGWAVMTDNLVDPNRVQMTFISGPYGSFNHSHANQNSFFIQAYGSVLAGKSGYYDGYNFPHNMYLSGATFAHNSVTVSPSIGQPNRRMSAKGEMTDFLTQQDFDLVTGDASAAYMGALDQFERSMIYIRPDIFVVIDDLAAPANTSKSFEWWLNAESDISIYDEVTGAQLAEGDALLDAVVQYPTDTKAYYLHNFSGSDMKEYPAAGSYSNSNVQRRVWFETKPVERTKMIVTMDVHRKGTEARYTDTEYFDDYVKMTFEDGTVIYVNLGDNTNEVTTLDGFTFTGKAVTVNADSVMLVSGTELKYGGNTLIALEKRGSVVMGANELSISTYEDNRISIHTANDFVDGVTQITDYDGRSISSAIGISSEQGRLVETEDGYAVEAAQDYITLTAEMDNYQLMLNGKHITGKEETVSLTLDIDGEVTTHELTGVVGRNGELQVGSTLAIPFGEYKLVEKSEGLNVTGLSGDDLVLLKNLGISTNQKENHLSISSTGRKVYDSREEVDYDSVKNSLAIFKEAENYDGEAQAPITVYTTRTFLSGGAGVQNFNDPALRMSYTFEVKEAGTYDFAIKYVSWDDDNAMREFTINGVDYLFTMPKTTSWGTEPGQWRAAVTDSGIELQPGKYTITFKPVRGSWNFDWFGFVKR